MVSREDDLPGLPPRPDRDTGLPFPPHAPGFMEKDIKPEDDRQRDIRLSRKPKPPPGMGPTLVWYRDSPRRKLGTAAAALGIMAVGASAISLSRGDGFAIFTYWWAWLIILGVTYLASNPFNMETVSAGADWLQWEQSRWKRRNWLKTYELTKIGTSYGEGQLYLDIYDDERGMSRRFSEFQRDRRIWDLLYNGILHSVANGAEIKPNAIGVLNLNSSPALRLRRERHQ